jgi:thiol-disulfide isomerase/thioredoxin
VLGRAPDFTDTQRWFNTGGHELSLSQLRGRVVLVDFWTYTCINCIRTLPALRAWDDRYRDRGLTIIGVHTPEFPFERNAGNVADAIAQNRLRYPVVQDNKYGTWSAWGNQYWPAKYLIDSKGRVRYTHFGEGEYSKTEVAIRSLLEEAGHGSLGRAANASPETPSHGVETPETYLGYEKAQGFIPPIQPGKTRYRGHPNLPTSSFALAGAWNVTRDAATAVNAASVDAHFGARKVFLVLSSAHGRPGHVRVLLDGRPVSPAEAGDDVHGGYVTVHRQRLYSLVSLPRVERRRLTLAFERGVSAYAFTFG